MILRTRILEVFDGLVCLGVLMILGLDDVDCVEGCDEIAGNQHGDGEDDQRLHCNIVTNRIGSTECPHIAIIR